MRTTVMRRALLAAAAGWAIVPRLAKSTETIAIGGAGSNFIGPVMQRWGELLPEASGVSVTFKSVGTGVAQSAVMAGEIDFAAVELPLPAKTLADGDLMQVPVAFGALVCVVNIPGIASNQILLTAQLLGDIYGGAIKTWDDPKIAAANPGAKLPNLAIRPIRLDTPAGSVFSTTYTFTRYLLSANQDWRDKYGTEVPRRWAVGSVTDSAESMVATIKLLPGSIGYMALGTATAAGMTTVMLRNKAGHAVAASLDSLRATVDRVDWGNAPDIVPRLVDLEGEGTWPLVLATYIVLPRNPKDPARGDAVRRFVNFVVVHGADGAAQRGAVALTPVPPQAQASAKRRTVRTAVLGMLGQAAD